MCSKSWVLATYILQKNPRRYILHLFLAAERGSPGEAVQHFFMKLFAVEYSNIHSIFTGRNECFKNLYGRIINNLAYSSVIIFGPWQNLVFSLGGVVMHVDGDETFQYLPLQRRQKKKTYPPI